MIEENRNGRLQFYGSPEFGKIYRHKNNEYLLMIAECSQGKSFFACSSSCGKESSTIELFRSNKKPH